jgi:hypothetical protein
MALPPTPVGYDSWNDYIETNAPALAIAQSITLQEAKASLKLLEVSEPIRSDVGQPYYRQYNVFTDWASRALLPDPGRPWLLNPPDPYFTSVSLLMHMNSSPSVDNSSVPKTITSVGGAVLSTSQYKFGGGSVLLSASGDYLQSANNSAFNIADQLFTVECWIYVTNRPAGGTIFSYGASGSSYQWAAQLATGINEGALSVSGLSGGSNATSSIKVAANTWTNIVFQRNANNIQGYINGQLVCQQFASSGTWLHSPSYVLQIGSIGGTSQFYGYIDELRITKGVARYTGNFTPQTSEFPDY